MAARKPGQVAGSSGGGGTAVAGGWWGEGPPPTETWPGVTIDITDVGGKYAFDEAKADRVCSWFPRYCSHSKGAFAGQKFELLPYQTQLILRPLFGWVRKSDGLRRFRKAFIEIPKKQGKTQLIAGLALYMLLADNEPGAEVYVAAADREQARILFNAAKAMVEANEALSKRLVVYRNSIVRKDDESAFFQVLSAEAATKHGPNIHCLIIDELHAQPDRDLFETLTRGVIARRQPLILLITTAGDDDESIAFEEYDYARGILSGSLTDEQHLPVIFEAKPDDDILSPEVWRRVNPGLGVTVTEEAMRVFATEAANEPRKRNDFVRYHLNRWVNQATAWLPIDWWDGCRQDLPSQEELAKLPCALGIDMAQKIDLAAAVAVFRLPLEGVAPEKVEVIDKDELSGAVLRRTLSLNYRIAIVPAFWLPGDTIRDRARQDRVPYDLWSQQAWPTAASRETVLNETDGAVIDADAIATYITRDLSQRFPLMKQSQLGYDPAFATELSIRLSAEGYQPVEVRQNYSLSEACQVFEALVKAKRVVHNGHPLMRWCVENVAVKTDDAGRIRMVKPKKAAKRIDGVVATVIALSRLMAAPPPEPPKPKPRISSLSW